MRQINLSKEKQKIIDFIREYLASCGSSKGIVGISGGIDSAVVAALSVEALGVENVLGLLLPYKRSNPKSIDDGLSLVKSLRIPYRIIDITPMVDAWFDNNEPDASKLRRGNYMARIRMTVLYDISAKEKGLVIGTGNFSELMSGYTTQYGDNACAFEPIGHLYKTEVSKLAETLNIPQSIIKKNPSADLWADQTDEDELGITYHALDEILYRMLEKQETKEKMIADGIPAKEVDKVKTLYQKSRFKREMPPCLKI